MHSEITEVGEQILIPGVAPIQITPAMVFDRLQRLRSEMRRANAKPLDIGFWDPMRNQLSLF